MPNENRSATQQPTNPTLDEYMLAMERRNVNATNSDLQDVYSQLADKERDLLLAAQLGKALLEKNEQLSMQNEKIAEEYSRQLEILEQEKHVLRRKLDTIGGEYETKIGELQSDISELKKSLDDQQTILKSGERQKSAIVMQLTEQNQRLTNQLKEAMKNEEQMSAQLQGLRDQFSLRKSSLQDHVGHLEIMREEILLLTTKKNELERRMQHLLSEREGLSSNLDESTDRIMVLERQCHEQEIHLREMQRQLEELRSANGSLCERIESISRHNSHSSAHYNGNSLLAEMDLSAFSSGRGSAPASSPNSQPSLHDDIEIDDIECDRPQSQSSLIIDEQNMKMKQEMMDASLTLHNLCQALRAQRRRASLSLSTLSNENSLSSPDETQMQGKFQAGMLCYLVKEVEALVRSSAMFQMDMSQCEQCGRSSNDLLQFESELHLTQEAADKLQRQLADKIEESKRYKDESTSLQNQLTLKQVELEATREERDTARRDAQETNLAKEDIIRRAWEVRDQAVARKNAAEIELARTRIDVLQINSQLLEAIQQKIELSQQLEQWQVDMQQLIDDQMKRKLSNQEILRSSMSSLQSQSVAQEKRKTTKKFLGIFQR